MEKENPIIEITHEEIVKIEYMVRRFNNHKHTVSKERWIAGEQRGSEFFNRKKGFTGELAVHKYFGLPYQFDFDPHYRKDDIVLGYKGHRVVCDVKASEDGVLKVKASNIDIDPEDDVQKKIEQPKALIAVKVFEEMEQWDRCEILGIISIKQFKSIAHSIKIFDKDWYCLVGGLQKYQLSHIDVMEVYKLSK